jgi:hypothetical protein
LDDTIDSNTTIEFSLNMESTVSELSLDNPTDTFSVDKVAEDLKFETAVVTNIDRPLFENVELEFLKIEFTPSRRKTQKRILINIEGCLTINNVEILYSKVNSVFENFDFVEVTLKNVTEIDLTVIQLFHAIRVIYWPLKKYISINAEFSRDDRKLLNTCGFTEFQTQVVATV